MLEKDFTNSKINNDYYSFLFDNISKTETSKRINGTYFICDEDFSNLIISNNIKKSSNIPKGLFTTKFYQIKLSNYHSWYFSDTPIAILCLDTGKSTSDENDKQEVLHLIKLEIDLMVAAGLTLVLCYKGQSISEDFLFQIIKDDQFSELHLNFYEDDKLLMNFLAFMKDCFVVRPNIFKGYIYLYSCFFEYYSYGWMLMQVFKKIQRTKIICFSVPPSEALKKPKFYPSKPFAYCKTGFKYKYLRVYLIYVPISSQIEYQSVKTEISGVSIGYVLVEDFLYRNNKNTSILFFDKNDRNLNKTIDYNNIHTIKPDLFVNSTLSLTQMKQETHESIKQIEENLNDNPTKNKKQKGLFRKSIGSGSIFDCIISVANEYTKFMKKTNENFHIRPTQIYAVIEACNMFFSNEEKKEKGVVYQIKTGEGKTCIITLIAAVLALKKKKVHIVSSNIKLSFRDYEESLEFFKNIDLRSSVLLHKNELPKNSDEIDDDYDDPYGYFKDEVFKNTQRMNFCVCGIDNENQTKKYKCAKVVFSTFVNLECFYLYLMENCPGYINYFKKCGLLIDEADSILIDEITNGTIVSREIKSNAYQVLSYVYKFTKEFHKDKLNDLSNYFKNNPMASHITDNDFKQMLKEIELVESNAFSNGKKYSIEQFEVKNKKRIENLFKKTVKEINNFREQISGITDFNVAKLMFQDNNESVDDEEEENEEEDLNTDKTIKFSKIVPFDYDQKGILEENKEFSGFIPQFIALKEGEMHEDLIFKDISISYLYISHPIFANFYPCVCGFTGTVGKVNDKETFSNHYKLITKKVPRFKPNLRVDFPLIACETILDRNLRIVDEVSYFHKKGNPVLVIFQDFKEIEAVKIKIFARIYKDNRNKYNKITVFDGKNKDIEPGFNAGIKDAISLGTNICGRGTNIHCSSSLPLHVIVAYYSKNSRVMNQAFGRTARNGQVGTCRCICLKKQLVMKSRNKDQVDDIVDELFIKSEMQREFIEEFQKERPWIFDFINEKYKYSDGEKRELKDLRHAKINVNRIVAYKFKWPICMTYEMFLGIQAQRIFSLFNCPNCKYTWRLFQKYVREMILQSWSLMIEKFDLEIKMGDGKNDSSQSKCCRKTNKSWESASQSSNSWKNTKYVWGSASQSKGGAKTNQNQVSASQTQSAENPKQNHVSTSQTQSVENPKQNHVSASQTQSVENPKQNQVSTSQTQSVENPNPNQISTSQTQSVENPNQNQISTSQTQSVENPKQNQISTSQFNGYSRTNYNRGPTFQSKGWSQTNQNYGSTSQTQSVENPNPNQISTSQFNGCSRTNYNRGPTFQSKGWSQTNQNQVSASQTQSVENPKQNQISTSQTQSVKKPNQNYGSTSQTQSVENPNPNQISTSQFNGCSRTNYNRGPTFQSKGWSQTNQNQVSTSQTQSVENPKQNQISTSQTQSVENPKQNQVSTSENNQTLPKENKILSTYFNEINIQNKKDTKKKKIDLYKQKLIEKKKELSKALEKYFPKNKSMNIVLNFIHICNQVINDHQEEILTSLNGKERAFISFGNYEKTYFQLGFKPYTLRNLSGTRITVDDASQANFIEDPELKYEKQMPNKKFTKASITERIDFIFNKIFQQISSVLGGKTGLQFFMRRTLAGCEFGICLDLLIDDKKTINNYVIIDKNPMLVFTIYTWSMAPLLAGILIILLIYIVKISMNIAKFIVNPSGTIISTATNYAKEKIMELANNAIPKVSEIFLTNAIQFLQGVLNNQISKLERYVKNEKEDNDDNEDSNGEKKKLDFLTVVKILRYILFKQEGYDKITDLIENKIEIPSIVGGVFEECTNYKNIVKIGLLLILCFATFLKNFQYKKRIEHEAKVAEEFNSIYDKKKSTKVSKVEEDPIANGIDANLENNPHFIKAKDMATKQVKDEINFTAKPMEEKDTKQIEELLNSPKKEILEKLMSEDIKEKEVNITDIQLIEYPEKVKKDIDDSPLSFVYISNTSYIYRHYSFSGILIDKEYKHEFSDHTFTCIRRSTNQNCIRYYLEISDFFYKVISLFKDRQHPAILLFAGYVINLENSFILFEIIKNKYNFITLKDSLKKNYDYSRNYNENGLILAYGIACGMEFLEKNDIHYISFFSRNVLLDDQLHPYIFPLQPNFNSYCPYYYNSTLIYAPELRFKPSKKSAVYSYGVVLFEISNRSLISFDKFFTHENFFNDSYNKDWINLIQCCLNENPDDRPSFSEICDIIESFKFKPKGLRKYIEELKPKRL